MADDSTSAKTPTSEEMGMGADQVAAAARDPELMKRMVSSALDQVTESDINRQRQNLSGAQGQKVMAALKKKGINPAQLRKQIKDSKSERGQQIHEMMQSAPLVIVLRSNKVLSKHIVPGAEEEFIHKTNAGSEAILAPCTILSNEDNTIFVCSAASGKVNKRATALVGYKVFGDVLFGRREGDLTVEAFESWKVH